MLLFFVVFNINTGFAQNTTSQKQVLYPIEENGLWGFINDTGKRIIPPAFHAVGCCFSDGLVPARKDGLYGYINKIGVFMIPPKFDYATGFEEGLAIAWIKDKPYFIDKNGNILFEHDFAELSYFGGNRLAKVEAKSGYKYGMIDQNGNLVVDTIYSRIYDFVEGRAIVHGAYNKEKNETPVGVIDENGNFVVPMGKFAEISNYQEGLAKVTSYELNEKGELHGVLFIDLDGKIAVNLPRETFETYLQEPFFENGRLTVALEKKGVNGHYQSVVIDKKGKIILYNLNYNRISAFSEGRAFARIVGNKKWKLIDEAGNIIGKYTFEEVTERGFENGLAFVKNHQGWGTIDRNGNWVTPPKFINIKEGSIRDSLFIFYVKTKRGEYFSRYAGIANLRGEIVVPAKFDYLFRLYGTNKMLYFQRKEDKGYIDLKGNYLWKEKKTEYKDKPLISNRDWRGDGYFFNRLNARGDQSSGYKSFKMVDIVPDSMDFVGNQIDVKVTKAALNQTPYLLIANTTQQDTIVRGDSNRFNIVIQAQGKDGVWKDIEDFPMLMCGYAYFSEVLHAGEYWKFEMIHYQGAFDTYLRVKFCFARGAVPSKTIYSNTFKGGVNPGQFWRQRAYASPVQYIDHQN